MPASKNTCQRGQQAEARVQAYLEAHQYKILRLRWRTPFAEVDIFAFHLPTKTYRVIEVKAVKKNQWERSPISTKQLQRLERACHYLMDRGYTPLDFCIALVDESGSIDLIPL